MAPTLSFRPSRPTVFSSASLVPPPSQDFAMQEMPNVLVTPPEEEHAYNPPWCYFDATQAARDSLAKDIDMEALDVALSFCQQTDNRSPTFHRTFPNESQETVVMPRRGSLIKLRGMELALEMEMEMALEQEGQPDIRSRRTSVRRFDEDVVEVVKYRRDERVTEPNEARKLKKTNTLRARATQAFRSIKNVGKTHRDRSATVNEPPPLLQVHNQNQMKTATLPTRHSCQEPSSSRPVSPSISRRKSLNLAQLFAFKDKENQASRPASPVDEFLVPTSPTLVDSDSAPSIPPMSPTHSSISHARPLRPSSLQEDYISASAQPLSSEEPSKPNLNKRRSFVRRLSVLELQKLFTLGGSNSTSPPEHASSVAADTAEDLFSPSQPQSRPKSLDSSTILTPSSSQTSNTSSYGELILEARPSISSQSSQGFNGETGDLEMRLDSLHFDSLHFDPDEILSSL